MDSLIKPKHIGAAKFVLANYDWHYRGEGNAKIAISLPVERKIVLLPKFHQDDNTNNSDYWHWLSVNVIFINSIFKSLLGKVFVSTPSLIYLSHCDIQLLNETLISIRPEKRKDKELLFCGGELWDDHVYLPQNMSIFCKSKSLCVELKPKQGVFPHTERHFRNCLFCRKQQLKIKDGLVYQKSLYCPLDLFSGFCDRMRSGVLSLLHSPQNNLRIFYDGSIAYGENHSDSDLQKVLMEWLPPVPKSNLVERFSSVLLQALTKDFTSFEVSRETPERWIFDGASSPDPKVEQYNKIEKDTSPPLPQPPCNYDRQELTKGSILHCIAQVQALDNLGTAAVNDILMSHIEYTDSVNNTLKSKRISYVNDILEKGCSSKLNPIERYLIAAVARDCSILITLQEMKDECLQAQALPYVVDEDSKTHFLCHIAAVDLGPKPISCINSQMEKKAGILKACHQTVN